MAKKRPQKSSNKKASSPKKTPVSKSSPPKAKSNSGSPIPPALQKPLLHVGLIAAFFVVALMYFSPILEGETLSMGDIRQFAGMTQQVKDFRAETGQEAFWTSRMFGGMPTYHAGLQYPNNLIRNIYSAYFNLIPPPISFIFLMFLGFYLLMNTMNVRPLFSFLGASAFAFSSYFFILMVAGHTSKAAAIGFMAPTVAGILMIYRGKWLSGGVITAFSMAFSLCANHVQITYYMGIMIILLGVALAIDALINKKVPEFAKATGVALLAVVLGVAPNIGHLYTSYEYVKDTIRGKSELTPKPGEVATKGLDIDYAFAWSYEVEETLTLLVPNFMGGASGTQFDKKSNNYKLAAKSFGRANANRPLPTFWGKPTFTSGPVYVGAIICFLFALGLILIKGPLKWGLLAATILFIFFSWGGNMMWFNKFIFNTLPLYNKFRAVSMALVIPEFTMPLLGVLGLMKLVNFKENGLTVQDANKALYISGGIVGGLCLILAVIGPGLFDFSGTADGQLNGNQQMIDGMIQIRKNMMTSDAWRSFLLIAAGFGLLWAYVNDRIKSIPLVVSLLAVLSIGDLWLVNKRYVNNDDFTRRDNYEKPEPSPSSVGILQDPAEYRVLNLTVNVWNSASTAFFHNDIGGYHPAKLRRYNDLIQNRLSQEIQLLINVARSEGVQQPPFQAFRNLHGLNMMNCKYIILGPGPNQYWRNPAALGNAWFVNKARMAKNADEELAALQSLNPALEAVIDQRYGKLVEGFNFQPDSASSIRQTSFTPNEVSYESNSRTDQLAIFSEVYYNSGKGWNCYVDGEKVDHLRANYVLRGLPLKAGKHTIEFKMQPESYAKGEQLSLISSIILMLLAAGAGVLAFMRSRQTSPESKEGEA
ncbi:MAG: YfhO family protein [Bacteroidia bacterium]|nr:YfhO family protein [Bacteroidia bacterium]